MKLHTKLLLSLLLCLALVSSVSLIFQQTRMSKLVGDRANENLRQEEDTQWKAIENLQRACNIALTDSMVAGEMDTFKRVLAAQGQVEGLQELTIFNKDGVATYSTSEKVLKAKLPDAVRDRYLKDTKKWRERTDDSFILYQPMPVSPACYECHPGYKTLASGGLYRYRFSTATLKEAQAQWVQCGEEINRSSWTNGLITMGILLVAASVAITILVRRQIAKPLNHVSTTLHESVMRLGTVASQITSTSEQLADGSQAQAASLEETSASVEETTSMAKRTSNDAQQTREAAAATRSAAETARAAMDQMHVKMEGIQKATTDVGKILKTIDEIAFQTNLLALNAAVEAARAGEAGAGFAVVADEVRSLAQRCTAAARSTAELTGQVTTQVQEGAAISNEVAVHLADILEKIAKEDTLVQQIASAAQEQSLGLSQVNDAVVSIDQVTQKNAGISEDAAAAARELNQQAEALEDQVQELVRLINGQRPSAPGAKKSS